MPTAKQAENAFFNQRKLSFLCDPALFPVESFHLANLLLL
jgi:hypothetical protein